MPQVTARMVNTDFQTAMKPLYVFPFVLMNVCAVQSAVSNVCLLKIRTLAAVFSSTFECKKWSDDRPH